MNLGIVYHMPCWRDRTGSLREVEGSFARYVDALAPYFDEVTLCVPFSDDVREAGTAIRSANVRIARLGDFDGPWRFYLRLPALLPRLFGFARSIDLLHCRVPTPAAVFAFAFARLLGRPAFLLVVGDLRALLPSMPYRGVKRVLWRAYTTFEERNVEWMSNRALTFANGAALAAKHSRARHGAIQTQTTTIKAAEIGTREDTCAAARIRILTVGRIDPRKGLRVLPAVLRRLVDRGMDVTLDIAGPAVGAPGQVEQQAIEEAAGSLGVRDRLTLLGAIALDRLLPLYRDYDVFVLPTLPGEGVPRVLLEAMAAGVPVIATRVAGIPSLVVHEDNGLLVDEPGDEQLAAATARVVGDGVLRRRLIARGYDTARIHTVDAQAARMMRDVASRLGLQLRHTAPAA